MLRGMSLLDVRPAARIVALAASLPSLRRSSSEVEAIIAANSPGAVIPKGIVESVTGIRERRVAAEGVFASDLAADAARQVLRKTATPPGEVDLLIYASAGQDLTEPATANIVQEKTGTACPVFDLKNACNSFLNGLEVAEALIRAGAYRTILVTVGETPTRGIKWQTRDRNDLRLSFPGYTLGDGGAAALVVPATDERGIFYRSFTTVSRYWNLATVLGGGSMYPRGDEYSYISGDAARLKDAFAELGPSMIQEALAATGTTFDDYSRILVHQVSLPFLRAFVRATGVPRDKIEMTAPMLGNMAAASLPVAFAQAEQRGAIQPGDRVMWIGLAGGISVGLLLVTV
jgi:3-oxoacyl-[acyl-carrier-protein] synthase III